MNIHQKTTKNWRDNDPDKETAERWKNTSENWIWGIFYFNKEDKRLFVSKKTEWMGMTLNFANPKWIFYIIGFICFYSIVLYFILGK